MHAHPHLIFSCLQWVRGRVNPRHYRVQGTLQLLMNCYGKIRFAHVRERVSTKSFVVLIIDNSKSNHLGPQGTCNPKVEECVRAHNSACWPSQMYCLVRVTTVKKIPISKSPLKLATPVKPQLTPAKLDRVC